jgi:enamine deaminase RidA (YjgF/YER057c/UK114 family)
MRRLRDCRRIPTTAVPLPSRPSKRTLAHERIRPLAIEERNAMSKLLSVDGLPLQMNATISRRIALSGAGLFMLSGTGSTAFAQTPQSLPTSHLRFLQPPNSSRQAGYSHVVEATLPGRVVYVAGQMGLDINGNLVGAPGDFSAQATQAWENVKGALATVGGGIEHIVKISQFLLHLRAHQPLLREVRAKFLDPKLPPSASTMVQVGAFTREGALYEVEAVAVLPPRAS